MDEQPASDVERDSEEPAQPDEAALLIAYSVADRPLTIETAAASRDWMSATRQHYANRCLPLLIANQSGWLLLNDTRFRARWSGGEEPDSLTISHDCRPGHRPLAHSQFGYGIITWSIPYLLRTPPGFNLHVRGPTNYPKDGVCALDGIVETDWTAATFTMNWKVTRPFTDIVFDEGEPFCMFAPQRRGELESFRPEVRSLDSMPADNARFQQFKSSREDFVVRLRQGALPVGSWQRDYFRGRDAGDGVFAPTHQTRLHLERFRGQE
ncbi:DUF6065 family protein [Streptomyces sp. M41]|uniref:DUF6065 family protein n=1 Tax=Streptomyces sp. M41 TaxID=3059412 RepID=UPI00374CC252